MAISLQRRVRGATPGQQVAKWTATVRRNGVSISATFSQKGRAQAWGHQCQDAIDLAAQRGVPFDREEWLRRGRERTLAELQTFYKERNLDADPDQDDRPRADWTLSRALSAYEETVTATKKGRDREEGRLKLWRARPLAAKRFDELTAAEIQKHIDERLAAGRAAMTIRNEVLLLSAVFKHAASPPRPGGGGGGWGLADLKNPVSECVLPPAPQGRERRLEDGHGDGEGEEHRMLAALEAGPDGPAKVALFTLAVETGMRLSELLDVRAEQVRRVRGARYIARPDSKNGRARRVVLSSRAETVIDALIDGAPDDDGPLIRLGLDAVEYRWAKARKRAGIVGLTMHDLRHEGLSRMAGQGLTIGELQAQSGHRTAQVLLRYVNARVGDVARKLG